MHIQIGVSSKKAACTTI